MRQEYKVALAWFIFLLLMLSFVPSYAEAKDVVTKYEDFLQIIATVEHSEKLKNRAVAEKGVLVKLNDEHKTIIKIQAEQIQACEKIVHQQEQLGATQEQLSQAVEMELKKVQKELEREKRLSRYKSEFVAVAGAILFRRMRVEP